MASVMLVSGPAICLSVEPALVKLAVEAGRLELTVTVFVAAEISGPITRIQYKSP